MSDKQVAPSAPVLDLVAPPNWKPSAVGVRSLAELLLDLARRDPLRLADQAEADRQETQSRELDSPKCK